MTDLANGQDAGTSFERLETLSISGFRGLDQLTIPRLGRIALIAGKNGVGKTTVLDAVRVYATRGQLDALRDLLVRREELTAHRDERGEIVEVPAFDRLFYRNGDSRASIAIGPSVHGPTLEIEDVKDPSSIPQEITASIMSETNIISVAFGDVKCLHHWTNFNARQTRALSSSGAKPMEPIRCESIGPGLLKNVDLASLWDEIALTDTEAVVVEALRLASGNRVERAAVIGEDIRGFRGNHGTASLVGRRVVVKLTDWANPVPLKSLGDGAARMFGVALALANCRDGFLLIDEAENGIHYSLQSKFWGMVLRTAEKHNTQVLATTHSKDCIDGFADAALANPNVDANFVRIGRRNGKLRAVDYSIEELETVAEQNFEVR